MSFLPFSTGSCCLRVENVLGPICFLRPCGTPPVPDKAFPQLLPHSNQDYSGCVFNAIAALDGFSTGSTTNTKNMNQRFSVVVGFRRQHPKEVGHAIQR